MGLTHVLPIPKVGVAVGRTGVAVGGIGVFVGGTGVFVGGTVVSALKTKVVGGTCFPLTVA